MLGISPFRGPDVEYPWLHNYSGVLLTALILIFSTYVFTKLRYLTSTLPGRSQGKQPLTLPYWIPFIGSSILMTKNAHAFYESTLTASPGGIVGARIGPMYTYIISGVNNIQTIFRNSKAQSTDHLILEVYRKVFNLPKSDLAFFEQDTSGHGPVPLTNVPEEKRIWRHVHDAQNKNLTGADQLKTLSTVFAKNFQDIVDHESSKGGQTVLLWNFFRNRMATASSIALIGSNVFKESNNIIEDFWTFFSEFMGFFMGYPRFLIPAAWDARQRLVEHCTRHLKNLEERYQSIQETDPEWDADLGARINRLRDKANKYGGVSIEARGALLLGFMMGINGNAIPIAGWILIELVQNPTLLSSIRDEVSSVILSDDPNSEDHTTDNQLKFDIPKLLSLPLLSSVYTETLRLRMSTTPTRQLRTDLEVGDYLLKAGNWVMLPSFLAHTKDPEWTSSSPEHPPTEFWAERFLSSKESKTPTQPKSGTFFPFGGGSTMCPGRFFAKQEILIAIAVMVMKFDFEFLEIVGLDGKAREEGLSYDFAGAGAGGLFPDGDLRCKIRERL